MTHLTIPFLRQSWPTSGKSKSQPGQSATRTNLLAGFEVKILTSTDDMANFEQQWRQLEEKFAKPSNVFQSYDWCKNWADICTADNDCYQLFIVTISTGSKCVLIWPMMTTCSGPFHILRWLSEPYSQYGDVMIDQTSEVSLVLELAWQHIRAHPHADSARFRHVRQDSNIANFLLKNADADNHIDYAPFLEIEKFPTEAAYEARYNKSQRRRRKRIRKSLEQNGKLEFSRANGGKGYLGSLRYAIAQKRLWLASRGLHSKPVMSTELEPFFVALAKNANSVHPIASQLNCGDKPVSFEIGLRFKGTHFGYITAHQVEFTNHSPARLHMDFSQRAAINDQMKAFDLMVPADPHKQTWSSNRVQTRDYFTHLNKRGALYTIVYLEAVRPIVRWFYLKTPPVLRRKFTGLMSFTSKM